MPPPPVTPSPHRFVIKKEAPVRRTPLAQEHKPPASTQQQQFNATPRFHFSSTPRPTLTQSYAAATPSASRYLTPARKTQVQQDAIDISSSDDTPHEEDVHDSIETEEQALGYLSADEEDEYALEEPTPKRRRLSSTPLNIEPKEEEEENHNQNFLSSSLPLLSSPPAPPAPRRHPLSTAASRFKTPAPSSTPLPPNSASNTHASTTTPFRKPPPFRPPDPSETTTQSHASDPLPEQFSPHTGKGKKYIVGGLTSTVQSWLFNVPSHRSGNGQRNREDPWLVRIRVDGISGSLKAGMTLVSGRQVVLAAGSENGGGDGGGERIPDDSGVVKVILAGEGQMTGLARGDSVEMGCVVGIKGPVWEVLVEGCKWGVGVEWKVLPS